MKPNQQTGLLIGLAAYFIWSLFPFYFKSLSHYDAIEVIGHRVIWTCIVLLFFLIIKKHWHAVALIKKNPKILIWTLISGVLIASNWLFYVWAVTHDKIIDASLGYFISPLMGVALSFFILKEELSRLQVVAIALAGTAIIIQVFMLGFFPALSLSLALPFAIYGLIQKRTPLDGVSGLFLETAMLVPFCIMWFATHELPSNELSFWVSADIWLLMMSGPVTLVPLLLYKQATKLVDLNILSFMQYIIPTSILIIAVCYYREPIDVGKLTVFGIIWLGLAVFSVDMLKKQRLILVNKKD
ncbi:EamA family transporter RarD [Moraxella oculi]|uniref:EamA family transporter RarD n=1 Tax=Moraxella oculi TaxID=2940516 RepID=A0ABW8U8M2_9GAMM